MINNIKNTQKKLKEYLDNIVLHWNFIIPVLLCIFVAYVLSLSFNTVSIDDMAQDIYYGSGNYKIKTLRWGQALVGKIFAPGGFISGRNQILGIIFLIITVIFVGCIFYQFDKNKNNANKYTILTCLFITYPLINEFWMYFESMTIPFFMLLACYCLLYQVINECKLGDYLLLGSIMSIVMSGYESLAFAYVTFVLIVIYIEYVIENKEGNWLIEGLKYSTILFIGLLLKEVIGYLLLFVLDLERVHSVAGDAILWTTNSLKESVVNILINGWYYFIRGLVYIPISEFVIGLIVFIVYVIRKQKNNKKSVLLGIFVVLSLFFLSFIQAYRLQYRTAQCIYIFLWFVESIVIDKFGNKKNCTIFLVLLICLQTLYLHDLIELNNKRSDVETAAVAKIGNELEELDSDKTVIFCGKFDLGEDIEKYITINDESFAGKIEEKIRDLTGHEEKPKYVEFVLSNVDCVLNWGLTAFNGQGTIKNYFAYCGYDINVLEDWENKDSKAEDELIEGYTAIAEKNGMKPLEVKEFADYILVYLGPVYAE